MKIGDMVKYDKFLGLEKCMGIIIGFDGAAIMVQWLGSYDLRILTVDREYSLELPDFLEVVSEA